MCFYYPLSYSTFFFCCSLYSPCDPLPSIPSASPHSLDLLTPSQNPSTRGIHLSLSLSLSLGSIIPCPLSLIAEAWPVKLIFAAVPTSINSWQICLPALPIPWSSSTIYLSYPVSLSVSLPHPLLLSPSVFFSTYLCCEHHHCTSLGLPLSPYLCIPPLHLSFSISLAL